MDPSLCRKLERLNNGNITQRKIMFEKEMGCNQKSGWGRMADSKSGGASNSLSPRIHHY